MEVRDILLSEETLFRDEAVFTPNYVPVDFIHRDAELKELALALKPGIRGVNPINTLIYGPPGTGKTTAVKYLYKQIKETTGKLLTVYINCEDASTPYGIYAKIYEKLYGFAPPSTGKPLEDIKERVYTKLKKEDKSIVVTLDELDRLFHNKNIEDILVGLLKAHTTYEYDRIGVIGIMIRKDHMAYLSEKTRSIYNPVNIEFKPYTREEIRDILNNRIKYGLYQDVISKENLKTIMEGTYIKEDLRYGIELLRMSAVLAERDSSKKITDKHVEEAKAKLQTTERGEEGITEECKELLHVIRENEGESSGIIYKKYKEKNRIGIKKYNQLIKELEYKELIKGTYLKGARGRSRILELVKG